MSQLLRSSFFNYAKWFANVCFALATISLLSPTVAAQSLFPWIAYLMGNSILITDSVYRRNWAWVWMAGFFSVWDILLITTRLFGIKMFGILEPLVKILETLP